VSWFVLLRVPLRWIALTGHTIVNAMPLRRQGPT
jgi:hypothetical protein